MFDLIIKNGNLVSGNTIDIAVKGGKIAKVAEKLGNEASQIIDLKNEHYISAGWIDAHVHCYEKMNIYSDFPDEIGIKTGVTSLIDAGSTGAENIRDFYTVAKKAKTNVYALINISNLGLIERDELADLNKIKEDSIKNAIKELPDFIVGIKARMSKTVVGDNGIKPLELAKKIQGKNAGIPLMVHIGSAPPELDEVLEKLSPGDVITHCFNGKENGILDQTSGKIKPFVWEAYKRGLVFDIGHGIASFDFQVAEVALSEGMKANSISTDIYSRNRINGPVYDFATTMEKLRIVGYSWKEIIDMVTAIPANTFHLKNKGFLEQEYDADFTIFDIQKEEKDLIDSAGIHRKTKEVIKPVKAIIGGTVYEINL